jgi:DNA processing protein
MKQTTTITTDELKYWLALHRTPGFGCAKLRALLELNEVPEALFQPQSQRLMSALNIEEKTRNKLKNPDWQEVEQDLLWQQTTSQTILVQTDPRYPPLLKNISDPPILLFVKGDPEILHYPQLGIVGSRNPSHDGSANAFEFAKFLSNAGIIITSGLAIGIDAAGHRGALAGNGLTVAVAGTGLDRVYPAANIDLAHEIIVQGALISEYSPGTAALPHHFPKRNRVISGLSIGVLVVEAAAQSGSLITARTAMEQNREVFAIPGSIHNPLARGCHRLIRQGAKLVETADDVLEELAPHIGQHLARIPSENQKFGQNSKLGSTAGRLSDNKLTQQQTELMECLGYAPKAIDTLVERLQLTPELISSMLIELELRGLVTHTAGRYSRVKHKDLS